MFAIGQLSEHCQPETGQRAKEILPAVFSLVNDPDSEVQEQAHYALQTFCESLGKRLQKVLLGSDSMINILNRVNMGGLVTCLTLCLEDKPQKRRRFT